MKKKILLSSIMTIALCLSLIAGSTYALFTDTSTNNISITAGKVKMAATLDALTLYSAKADATGTLEDENGNMYVHEELSQFKNGGTADFTNAVLTLDKVTPGDKVAFSIVGENTSNVTIQYRFVIECIDEEYAADLAASGVANDFVPYELMKGLVVKIGTETYTGLKSYTSTWTELEVGEDMATVPVSIELPIAAGNEYQETVAKIRIVVEAVQGNAAVTNNAQPAELITLVP